MLTSPSRKIKLSFKNFFSQYEQTMINLRLVKFAKIVIYRKTQSKR